MSRPYASLYLLAMSMGFTRADVSQMRLSELHAFADAHSEMHGGGGGDRWADQSDIDALFS